ncbi:stage II sporulation protein E [Anaeromicrobium sediminis]|uniref:Stage II sporulation protein E n=1 Tax=Anaeromicrobium sediminis TaxID=1478221 RepID=A0A267MDS2_9FIRM|nr:stage II sporulation protein E [Anaeromicrobium sediminis]PAB57627.1 stage II sporulation protein E [Anaeromicrobium sediminis]
MEKYNAFSYDGQYADPTDSVFKYGNSDILKNFYSKDVVIFIIGAFLLGRAHILGGLAPFGIALFGFLVSQNRKNVYLSVSVLGGIASTGMDFNMGKYMFGMIIAYSVFYYMKKINYKPHVIGIISSVSILISGSIYIYLNGLYLYDLLMLLFEALVVFVFTYILYYSVPVFLKRSNRSVLSNEEVVCMGIFVSIVISGLSDLFIGSYQIKNMFGILIVILFAYNGGASIGASTGITIGIITSMSSIDAPYIVGIYGFCGLLSGIFKDLGKWASIVGMLLGNIILTFYVNGTTEVFIQHEEMIIAFIMFLFMPKSVLDYTKNFVGSNTTEDGLYSEKIKNIGVKKLKEYSSAFLDLASTYKNIADKERKIDNEEVSRMVDEVAGKVCSDCGMCRSCWQNNFYSMYNGVVESISLLETEGALKNSKVPKILKKRCIKVDLLTQSIRDRFEIWKLNYHWEKKILENRRLVGEQFEGISEIFNNLAEDMNNNVNFLTHVEDALYVAFDKAQIQVDKINVLEKENKFEIEIQKRTCYGRGQCEEKIIGLVSDVVGKDLVCKKRMCSVGDDKCVFVLEEAHKYRIATGVARVAKDNRWICGDNYSFLDLEEGKHMIALSDGMGSGEKANKESKVTINILEQLMGAGFEKDLAIKTINSILVLKSSDEIFSTMDLSMVDLYTGKVEFVKIGAASSYIKRKNGDVEPIKSTSLPIGILNNVDIETFGYKLDEGDFVIMMSDGISDADKEEWVLDFLKNNKSRNPQDIADKLLDEAIVKYDNEVKDDMTVLVSKMWSPNQCA